MSLGDFHLARDFSAPSQGRTILARRKTDSELFILKEFASEDSSSREEAEKLLKITHENLIRTLSIFAEPGGLFYVQLEFCDGGSLDGEIRRLARQGLLFDEQQICEWFAQVVDAVAFLHSSLQLVHGNVSAKTVFLTNSRHLVKLGTLQQLDKQRTKQDDAFLLGALLYHLLSLKLPVGVSYENVLDISAWQGRDKMTSKYSLEVTNLSDSLLSADPNQRPTVASLLLDGKSFTSLPSLLSEAIANREKTLLKAKNEEASVKRRCKNLHRDLIKWGYACDNGPSTWPKDFPSGRGNHQSPVNIDTMSPFVRYDETLTPLEVDYSKAETIAVFNAGHFFAVNFNPEKPATLIGGPLSTPYQLFQYHAHWGEHDECHGCEHTINGVSYPAEMHFVHFNKAKYGTFLEALNHEDGLAVIGVFLQKGEMGPIGKAFQKVVDDFRFIRYKSHDVTPIDASSMPNPRALMPPGSLDHYYTYSGSLTSPPLCQCVTWMVLAEPVTLPAEQFAEMRDLRRLNNYQRCDHNYRPVQPLNDRIVRASFRQAAINGNIHVATPCSE